MVKVHCTELCCFIAQRYRKHHRLLESLADGKHENHLTKTVRQAGKCILALAMLFSTRK